MKIYMTLFWVMKFLYEFKSTASKTNIRQNKEQIKKVLHWKKMTIKRDKKSLAENIYRPCIRNGTNTLTLQGMKIILCK